MAALSVLDAAVGQVSGTQNTFPIPAKAFRWFKDTKDFGQICQGEKKIVPLEVLQMPVVVTLHKLG